MIDHSINTGSGPSAHTVSRRLQFVSVSPDGQTRFAGWAPHLDLEPISVADRVHIEPILRQAWLDSDLETRALA